MEGRCVFDLRLAAGPDAGIGDVGVQDDDGPIALDRQGADAVQDEGRLAGGRRHRLGGLADLLAGELGLDLAGQEAPEGGAVALDEGGEEGAGQGEELLLVGGGVVGGGGGLHLGFGWGGCGCGGLGCGIDGGGLSSPPPQAPATRKAARAARRSMRRRRTSGVSGGEGRRSTSSGGVGRGKGTGP